jgi:hypothetical protein
MSACPLSSAFPRGLTALALCLLAVTAPAQTLRFAPGSPATRTQAVPRDLDYEKEPHPHLVCEDFTEFEVYSLNDPFVILLPNNH